MTDRATLPPLHGLTLVACDLVPVGMRWEIHNGLPARYGPLAAPFSDTCVEGLILNPADFAALKERQA